MCGETLNATTRPVDIDGIQIFTPCPRFSDCCFYTEENLQGEEWCLPSRASQPDRLYKSYQCLPGMKPRVNGRVDLPCPRPATAETFRTPAKQGDIDLVPCEGERAPRAENADENLASFQEVNNDLGSLASFEPINTFNADFAATEPVDNTFNNYNGDFAATESVDNTFNNYNGDFAATEPVDNTFNNYNGDFAATESVDNTFNNYNGDFAATEPVDNTFNNFNGDFAATESVDNTFNDFNGDFAATESVDSTFNDAVTVQNVDDFQRIDPIAATESFAVTDEDPSLAFADTTFVEFGDAVEGAAGIGVSGGCEGSSCSFDSFSTKPVEKSGVGQIMRTLVGLVVGLAFLLV